MGCCLDKPVIEETTPLLLDASEIRDSEESKPEFGSSEDEVSRSKDEGFTVFIRHRK